jgi:hypothetical protein
MQKRKLVESENRHLFSDIVDSEVRQGHKQTRAGLGLDIGHQAQVERLQRVAEDRRRMVDELDRQIQEKERLRQASKEQDRKQYELDLSYRELSFDSRRRQNVHHQGQNPTVYLQYQKMLER